MKHLTDCHFHIFNQKEASLEEYRKVQHALGIKRGVIVQAGPQGMDNSALLSALQTLGASYRGVVVIPPHTSEKELHALHEKRIRGVRINLVTEKGLTIQDIPTLEPKLKDLGWHFDFYLQGKDLPALYDTLHALTVPYVIDHMGHFSPHESIYLQTLLRLLEKKNSWIKLSAPYRLSSLPFPYPDLTPIIQAIIRRAPDRMVWGSDWPHMRAKGDIPKDSDLLALFSSWVQDPSLKDALFSHNPQKLYDF